MLPFSEKIVPLLESAFHASLSPVLLQAWRTALPSVGLSLWQVDCRSVFTHWTLCLRKAGVLGPGPFSSDWGLTQCSWGAREDLHREGMCVCVCVYFVPLLYVLLVVP
jgi:hypothetical protein